MRMLLVVAGFVLLAACHSNKEECDRLIVAIHDTTMMKAQCSTPGPRTQDETDIERARLEKAAKDFELAARDMDQVAVKTPALIVARDHASAALRDEQHAADRYATLARQFKPDGVARAWSDTNDCKAAESALEASLDDAAKACKK